MPVGKKLIVATMAAASARAKKARKASTQIKTQKHN